METSTKSPLVSVILVTCDNVLQLKNTISTILSQSYKNFELLIVGNETDCVDITDTRIRYIGELAERNNAAKKNLAINNAQGKYLAFCAEGDQWVPTKLQQQVDFMENKSDIDMSFGYAINTGLTNFPGLMVYSKEESNNINCFENLLSGNKIVYSTVMIRANSIFQVGAFDECAEFDGVENYDLWLRISRVSGISCISEVLGYYFVSLENDNAKILCRKKLIHIVDKFYANDWIDDCLLGKAKANISWMIGNALLTKKDAAYRRWFVMSITNHLNTRSCLALLLLLLPISLAVSLFNQLEYLKVQKSHGGG